MCGGPFAWALPAPPRHGERENPHICGGRRSARLKPPKASCHGGNGHEARRRGRSAPQEPAGNAGDGGARPARSHADRRRAARRRAVAAGSARTRQQRLCGAAHACRAGPRRFVRGAGDRRAGAARAAPGPRRTGLERAAVLATGARHHRLRDLHARSQRVRFAVERRRPRADRLRGARSDRPALRALLRRIRPRRRPPRRRPARGRPDRHRQGPVDLPPPRRLAVLGARHDREAARWRRRADRLLAHHPRHHPDQGDAGRAGGEDSPSSTPRSAT